MASMLCYLTGAAHTSEQTPAPVPFPCLSPSGALSDCSTASVPQVVGITSNRLTMAVWYVHSVTIELQLLWPPKPPLLLLCVSHTLNNNSNRNVPAAQMSELSTKSDVLAHNGMPVCQAAHSCTLDVSVAALQVDCCCVLHKHTAPSTSAQQMLCCTSAGLCASGFEA